MGKGKIAAIVCLSLILVLIAVCMIVFYQVPFDYDIASITPIATDVRLLAADDPLNGSGSPALAKVKDGVISEEDFRILFLTDVHLCERRATTRETIERMVAWITAEQPDLIILGGDTLNGLNDRVRVEQFRDLMDAFGVYWAPVLGNHEGDRPFLMTSRKKVVEIWSESPLCLMESDEKHTADGRVVDGYGNYALSILGADGKAKNAFFFLDNGSKLMEKADYEKWGVSKKADTAISQSQVDWYEETYAVMKALNGGTLTHMCVIHKPLQVLGEAIVLPDEFTYGEVTTWSYSIKGSQQSWEYVDGDLRDKIHCPPYTDGDLYAALVRNGARAVFFGHDHVNDLTLYNREDDIYLTYIRLTTVTERIPDAEGYNVMTVGAHGGYDYRAYKVDGSLDAELFVG
ncbi:MAG: metallophosphoesterase [Clostridia bacterium]|nr:metallophosphoesterase [Clostridia bacterium]